MHQALCMHVNALEVSLPLDSELQICWWTNRKPKGANGEVKNQFVQWRFSGNIPVKFYSEKKKFNKFLRISTRHTSKALAQLGFNLACTLCRGPPLRGILHLRYVNNAEVNILIARKVLKSMAIVLLAKAWNSLSPKTMYGQDWHTTLCVFDRGRTLSISQQTFSWIVAHRAFGLILEKFLPLYPRYVYSPSRKFTYPNTLRLLSVSLRLAWWEICCFYCCTYMQWIQIVAL